MKDFYTVPETKDEMIANIDEMNAIERRSKREWFRVVRQLEQFGKTPNAINDYQSFANFWLKNWAMSQDSNNWKQLVISTYAEWGYKATNPHGDIIEVN